MHPRLQNKTNWTYCIKLQGCINKALCERYEAKDQPLQAFMLVCDWSFFASS